MGLRSRDALLNRGKKSRGVAGGGRVGTWGAFETKRLKPARFPKQSCSALTQWSIAEGLRKLTTSKRPRRPVEGSLGSPPCRDYIALGRFYFGGQILAGVAEGSVFREVLRMAGPARRDQALQKWATHCRPLGSFEIL